MDLFVRAVIAGFGQSLGKALFDRIKHRLGLGDDEPRPKPVTDIDTIVADDEESTRGHVIEFDTNVINDDNDIGRIKRSALD